MGSHGGSAPNPYSQRRASTLYLRVPYVDWTRVKIGEKTEFRTTPREGSRLLGCYLPTPVVAYAVNRTNQHDAKLMVLEARRYEPLFNISTDAEALRREGFETYDLFRRYWRKRQHGIYRPMQSVWVWSVRPFDSRDADEHGRRLLEHLYGEWL